MAGYVVTTLWSICDSCGVVYERDKSIAQCNDCKPKDDGSRDKAKGTKRQQGYDQAWRRLSKRARALQPFCLDCGSPDDLTADHSVATWERKKQGKALRLQDIDVVCRTCNGERGAARGERASDRWRKQQSAHQIKRGQEKEIGS